MAESSMRAVRPFKKDRISELPQNVQETILCLLPIEDAVRTSFLSRSWRHRWTMIPHLIFNLRSVLSIMEKHISDEIELNAHKFVTVINKVLLLHNGPILKFSLIIPGDHVYDAKIIHDYISQWISLLSKSGIKQLFLEDSVWLKESYAHHFSSLDLTHLRLLSIWFPSTPACGRFVSLKIIELVDATSEFGQSIIDCPVLEKLTLISCEGLFPQNFCAPNLQCLVQVYHKITLEYSLAGLEKLEQYSCMLLDDYPIVQTQALNVVIVPGGLQKIEFSVAREFIKYMAAEGSPNRLSKPLSYLKTLNISRYRFHCFVGGFLFTLFDSECSQLVQTTYFKYDKEGSPKNYWIEDSEDCTIGHLEIVKFCYFSGLRDELELVKFLLAHSPSLKTLFIHRYGDIEEGAAALTITEEMLQYTRASSSRAQIRHLKHPVIENDNFEFNLWSDYTF